MTSSFIDGLRAVGEAFDRLATACEVKTMPVFIDLCWGENFDVMNAIRDPGIQFDCNERRFVLARLDDEIRFYAGPSHPECDEIQPEIGVFPDEVTALVFGMDFLIKKLPVTTIVANRVLLSEMPTKAK